jgi:hypothetical protein
MREKFKRTRRAEPAPQPGTSTLAGRLEPDRSHLHAYAHARNTLGYDTKSAWAFADREQSRFPA